MAEPPANPASVRLEATVPGYLGTKNNPNSLLTQMAVQAFVLDDANQPATSISGGNVQVRILPGTEAAAGARLVSGAQSGSVFAIALYWRCGNVLVVEWCRKLVRFSWN